MKTFSSQNLGPGGERPCECRVEHVAREHHGGETEPPAAFDPGTRGGPGDAARRGAGIREGGGGARASSVSDLT